MLMLCMFLGEGCPKRRTCFMCVYRFVCIIVSACVFVLFPLFDLSFVASFSTLILLVGSFDL